MYSGYSYQRYGSGHLWKRQNSGVECQPKSKNQYSWNRQDAEKKGESLAKRLENKEIQKKETMKSMIQKSSVELDQQTMKSDFSAHLDIDENDKDNKIVPYNSSHNTTFNNDTMRKVGSHKLILRKDGLPTVPYHKANTHQFNIDQSTSLKKYGTSFGKNKLILRKQKLKTNYKLNSYPRSTVDALPIGMVTNGHNKIVSEARLLQVEKEKSERRKLLLKKRNDLFTRVRGKGTAKRIKLNEIVESSNKGREKDEGNNPVIIEKLSDFAYQKTTKVPRHKYRRNMGLVRMANSENVPICPTFARGLHCTNRLCIKRHDVPIESYTPICLYFQRSGQCLKRETCPFRHIKVNPHAMICSSFALLGYCEKKGCVMKHIKSPKPPQLG